MAREAPSQKFKGPVAHSQGLFLKAQVVGSKRPFTSEGQTPGRFQRLSFEPWCSGSTAPGVVEGSIRIGVLLQSCLSHPQPKGWAIQVSGAGSERGLVGEPLTDCEEL